MMKIRMLLAAAFLTSAWASGQDSPEDIARTILAETGVRGGLVAHVGCVDGRLTAALHVDGRYTVHGLAEDAAQLAGAREHIRSLGLYGPVSVALRRGQRLPYADNTVNLLVVEGNAQVDMNDAFRALVPRGVAYVQRDGAWVKTVKPWPEGLDEWSHNAHGPDGNPVADDTVVGPPKHYQWVSGPRWLRAHDTDSSVNALVTANGLLFYLVDEAPASLPGQHSLPDKWYLMARDAFNGLPLWRRHIEHWGWREWKETWFKCRPGSMPLNLHRRVVGAGENLYATLGYRAPVSRLDAATGETLHTYDDTERTNEIIHHDGTLFFSMNRDESVVVAAYNAESGKRLWATPAKYAGTKREFIRWKARWGEVPEPELDAVANLAVDSVRVCFMDGGDVVCLDRTTGDERWRSTIDDSGYSLWVGTLIMCGDIVLHATPTELVALDAATGEQAWRKPKRELGWLWFEWKDVFVIDGLVWTWSAECIKQEEPRSSWPKYLNGYDLATGGLEKQIDLGFIFAAHHHHRCYRNKATSRYVLASRRGTEYIDLSGGEHSVHNWVRGTCHLGMMPANGLQYAPPHPCACYGNEKLNGFNALAPARQPFGESSAPRLERGPTYGTALAAPAKPGDWPAYRHETLRTACADTAVSAKLDTAWTTRLGAKVSAPVAAAGKVFAAVVDEHAVVALDAGDGRELWRFTADGRVDSPPTWHKGFLVFGSADGAAYCLRASDGALAWRFRAAPHECLIGAFDQLESAWPIHGSVLVARGPQGRDAAYFVAGRSSYLDGGMYLCAVDVATGELLAERLLDGPETPFDSGTVHFEYGGGPGALPDILQADERGVYLRNLAYDFELNPISDESKRVRPLGGFLDDSYFRRAGWRFTTNKNWGRVIAHDDQMLYYLRMFRDLRCLDPNNYFTPGKDMYLLLGVPTGQVMGVTVPNSPSNDPRETPITLEAWVKAEKNSGVIIARGGISVGYALALQDGRPQFTARINEKPYSVTAPEPVTDTWTHLAGVLSEDGGLAVYVNGACVAAGKAPSMLTSGAGQPTDIGADTGNNSGEYQSPFAFTGLIDEACIYHCALPESEIAANAKEPGRAPEGAVMRLTFDEEDARDSSGHGNDGIVTAGVFVPGKSGKAARFEAQDTRGWSVDIPVRGKAMVLAGELLFLAGPPDVVDEDDPLAAFEGRKGGQLWVFQRDSGEKQGEYELGSPPVFNGMAASNQRLYIATEDGSVRCLAPAG